jgi:hypothetical protein
VKRERGKKKKEKKKDLSSFKVLSWFSKFLSFLSLHRLHIRRRETIFHTTAESDPPTANRQTNPQRD